MSHQTTPPPDTPATGAPASTQMGPTCTKPGCPFCRAAAYVRGHVARTVGIVVIAAAVIGGAFALAGCGSSSTTSSTDASSTSSSAATEASAYHLISPDTAASMIETGNVTIVDVRRADEYAAGHIPGAINIPNESIGSDKPAELTDTSATLIVYCRTGVRSKQASNKLVAMGYENVYDMDGGFTKWTGETSTE